MWRPLILVGLCLLLAVRADERVQSHDPATTSLPSLVPIKELEQQLKEAVSDIKKSAAETTTLADKASKSAKTAVEKADETSHNVQELGQESLKTVGDTRSAINTAVAEQRRLIEQHEQEENKRRAQEEAFKTGADSKDAVADQKRQFARAHKSALREMAHKEKLQRKQKKLHRREVKAKKQRRKHERAHKKRERLAMKKRRKTEEHESKQYAREEKIEREEEKRERIEEHKAEQAQLKQEELDEKKAQLEADAHHKAEAAAENNDYKQEFSVSFLESSIDLKGDSLPGDIPVNNKVDRARHPGAHPDTLFSVHPAVSDILDIDAVTPQQKELQRKALAKQEARKKQLIMLRHRAKALEFKGKNARRNAERKAKVDKRRRRLRRIRNRLRRHVHERKHKAMVARRKRCERRKKQKKRQEERGHKRREKYRKFLNEKRAKTQAKARELKQKTEAKKKAAERKAKAIAAKIREAKLKHAQHQNLVRERTIKWEQFKVKTAQGAAAEKERRRQLLEKKMGEAKQKAGAAAVDAGAQQSRQGLVKLKELEAKSQTKWVQQKKYWEKIDEGRHKSWATQRRQHEQWMAEQRQFDLKLRAHLAWWKIQGRWEIRAKQAQRDYTESAHKYRETSAKHAAMARDVAEKKAKYGQRERSRKAHPHYQKLRALRLKRRLARQRRREARDKRSKESAHKVAWRKNFEGSWKQFTERSGKSALQDQQREKQFNVQVLSQAKQEESAHKSWYEQQNKRLEQLSAGELREKTEMRAKSDAADVQERSNKAAAIARHRQRNQERKAKFDARRQRYRGDKQRRERTRKQSRRGRVSPKICRRRVVKLYRRFHRRDPPANVFQRHYSTCLSRSCNRACLKRRIRRSAN